MPGEIRFIMSMMCLGSLGALAIVIFVAAVAHRESSNTDAACPGCGRKVPRFTETCPGCGQSLIEDD